MGAILSCCGGSTPKYEDFIRQARALHGSCWSQAHRAAGSSLPASDHATCTAMHAGRAQLLYK